MIAPSPAERSLLVLDGARIALSDGSLLAPLSARADGDRVALLGAWGFLFRLLTGAVKLAEGKLSVGGIPAEQALASGRVGIALAEPALVAAWTLRRYLTESATLGAVRRAAPEAMASEVIARFGFETLAGRRLGSFNDVERRAVGIIHATLGSPEVLVFERPLARLDAVGHDYLAGLIERAVDGRRAVISVLDRESPERTLLERAETTLVLGADRTVTTLKSLSATPVRSVIVTVSRHGADFQTALSSRGLRGEPLGPVEVLSVILGEIPVDGIQRFRIPLRDPTDRQSILHAALDSDAPLIELANAD